MGKRIALTKEEAEEAVAVYGSQRAAARVLDVSLHYVRSRLDPDAAAHKLQHRRVATAARYRTDPAWRAKQVAAVVASAAKRPEHYAALRRTHSAANRDRITARVRERRDARRAAGLCQCGRPVAAPHAGCLSCLERARAYQQMKRSNKP